MKGNLVIYIIKMSFTKAFDVMERKVNLKRNMIFHLEISMVMYSIYNAETMEKIVNTLEKKCITKLNVWVISFIDLIDTYQEQEWSIML